jgi:hypothetical protein
MTREEQILNKAIDYSEIEENFLEYDDCGDVCDDKYFIQKAFESGAKWADKTQIEKVLKFIFEYFYEHPHVNGHICTDSFESLEELEEELIKAMEE